jgi:hypothetical protein
MDLQERILAATYETVGKKKPIILIMNALVYAIIAGMLVYVLYPDDFGLIDIGVCIALGVAYSFIKDAFAKRRIKEILKSHLDYVRSTHPHTELYVPMLEVSGNAVLLKRSGLFIEDGDLALEAFSHAGFAKKPKDGITVPCGIDFRIIEAADDDRHPLTAFRAELMKNPYTFFAVRNEEVTAKILAFADGGTKGSE